MRQHRIARQAGRKAITVPRYISYPLPIAEPARSPLVELFLLLPADIKSACRQAAVGVVAVRHTLALHLAMTAPSAVVEGRADGSGVRRLAQLGGDDATVAWSPAGGQLFVYGGTGSYLVDANTGQVTPIPYPCSTPLLADDASKLKPRMRTMQSSRSARRRVQTRQWVRRSTTPSAEDIAEGVARGLQRNDQRQQTQSGIHTIIAVVGCMFGYATWIVSSNVIAAIAIAIVAMWIGLKLTNKEPNEL